MASHRKPRPGGSGPGLRTPALATAAFTSVAVLSQTAEAAPVDDGRPSVEEIEKKIDEFYRRAESPAAPSEDTQERTGRQWGRLDSLRGKAAFSDGPQEPERDQRPPDYFHQTRLMDRLASTVKKRQETARSTETDAEAPVPGPPAHAPERAGAAGRRQEAAPAAAPAYDPKTAKAAVQHKLAAARGLLARLTAPAEPPPAPALAPTTAPAPAPAAPLAQAQAPTPAEAGPRGPREAAAPSYGTSPGGRATRAGLAIAFARAQIGKPYVNGASGPGSYDCAGLTRAAWKAAGVILPRTARAQAALGTTVPLADARPGDLVFFHEDLSHVGLCTGDGTMIHAPGPGAYVREESVQHGGDRVVHSVVRPA
ncbi:C40 family peptidase [Streptomyces sp. IBSBF 3136]|uniref:C40 family peptidase n=1 Tax=Streptomyces sp. IBSBF 3136 TaxID=2903524 RepID=UPI002FDBA10B